VQWRALLCNATQHKTAANYPKARIFRVFLQRYATLQNVDLVPKAGTERYLKSTGYINKPGHTIIDTINRLGGWHRAAMPAKAAR